MTGIDHEHSAAIDMAVDWLVTTPRDQIEGSPVPAVMQRFGLSPQEACEAARQAFLRRARAQ